MGQHSGCTVWEESQALTSEMDESMYLNLLNVSPAVQDDVVDPLVYWSQGDVVIQELTVLHQHQGVAGVQVRHVGVDHDGDQARGGQSLVTNGAESGPGDRC